MGYLVFVLVVLVIIDHLIKDKRYSLLYYKNNHHFSIVVAITQDNDNLNQLFQLSKKTEHQFIFMNVNQVIDPKMYPDIVFYDVKTDMADYDDFTALRAHAYYQGYQYATNEFLLFMDETIYFSPAKALSHIANNLVEHQLFTLKPTAPRKSLTQGYSVFLDIYKDMNTPHEHVNYRFFAIKQKTYELAQAQNTLFKTVRDFEHCIELKNIRIHHIDHRKTVYKHVVKQSFSQTIRDFYQEIRVAERLPGKGRMVLFLFALHIFYAGMILDFQWIFLLLIALVHQGVYLMAALNVKHHIISFIFLPIYLIMFDFIFILSNLKRKNYNKKIKKIRSE